MRNFGTTIKELASKAYFKASAGLSVLVGTAMAAIPTSAYAGGAGFFDSVANKSSGDAGTTVLGTILNMFKFAALILGIIMLLIGIIQFATAFRNEDAEGKTKASHVLIAGLILTIVGGVMTALVGAVLN